MATRSSNTRSFSLFHQTSNVKNHSQKFKKEKNGSQIMSSSLRSFFLLSAFEKFKKKTKKKEEKKEWFRDERRRHHNFKTCFLNARIERKTPLFIATKMSTTFGQTSTKKRVVVAKKAPGCSKCRYAARGCRKCVENFVTWSEEKRAKTLALANKEDFGKRKNGSAKKKNTAKAVKVGASTSAAAAAALKKASLEVKKKKKSASTKTPVSQKKTIGIVPKKEPKKKKKKPIQTQTENITSKEEEEEEEERRTTGTPPVEMHSPNGRHEYIGDNEEEKGEEDEPPSTLKRALQKSLFFFDEEEATGEVDVGVARTPLKPVQPSSLVKLTERKEPAVSPLTLRTANESVWETEKGPEQMKNRLRQEALRQEETEESRGAREKCRKAEEFETTKSKLSFDTEDPMSGCDFLSTVPEYNQDPDPFQTVLTRLQDTSPSKQFVAKEEMKKIDLLFQHRQRLRSMPTTSKQNTISREQTTSRRQFTAQREDLDAAAATATTTMTTALYY